MAHPAVHLQADDAARAACQGNAGRVGSGGQGGNGIYGLLNVLVGAHHIHAVDQRCADHAAAFAGAGGHLVDAFHVGDGGFHGQQQALLDIFWGGAWVADGDLDDFRFELRKDLFLDGHRGHQAAHDEQHHHQVGGNAVIHHPRQRAFTHH